MNDKSTDTRVSTERLIRSALQSRAYSVAVVPNRSTFERRRVTSVRRRRAVGAVASTAVLAGGATLMWQLTGNRTDRTGFAERSSEPAFAYALTSDDWFPVSRSYGRRDVAALGTGEWAVLVRPADQVDHAWPDRSGIITEMAEGRTANTANTTYGSLPVTAQRDGDNMFVWWELDGRSWHARFYGLPAAEVEAIVSGATINPNTRQLDVTVTPQSQLVVLPSQRLDVPRSSVGSMRADGLEVTVVMSDDASFTFDTGYGPGSSVARLSADVLRAAASLAVTDGWVNSGPDRTRLALRLASGQILSIVSVGPAPDLDLTTLIPQLRPLTMTELETLTVTDPVERVVAHEPVPGTFLADTTVPETAAPQGFTPSPETAPTALVDWDEPALQWQPCERGGSGIAVNGQCVLEDLGGVVAASASVDGIRYLAVHAGRTQGEPTSQLFSGELITAPATAVEGSDGWWVATAPESSIEVDDARVLAVVGAITTTKGAVDFSAHVLPGERVGSTKAKSLSSVVDALEASTEADAQTIQVNSPWGQPRTLLQVEFQPADTTMFRVANSSVDQPPRNSMTITALPQPVGAARIESETRTTNYAALTVVAGSVRIAWEVYGPSGTLPDASLMFERLSSIGASL
jgi:hypothetical protein